MEVYIKHLSYYLPDFILTNEQLINEFPEWTVEKVAKKIGIEERHITAQSETAVDMAVKASEKLFYDYRIDKNIVDFILLCTQSPDYFLPTSACIVQHRLDLPTSCGALDFNLGCSGFVYGLALAKGLIISNVAKNVLLITSETYSKHIHPKDKGNRTIFGDAAAAILISTDGIAEILDFSLGTDGAGADNLIVRTGGLRQPEKTGEICYDETNTPVSDDYLYMNGAEIFTFTLDAVPALVDNTLNKNNLTKEDIDLFVFHQANKYMMDFLRKKINIGENRFYYCLAKMGNTVSSTIPIALYEAMKDNTIQKGNKILLAGFGVGYSWAGNVLQF
jgi:3-oxoacyl-[acyl-carrier-protein] synthase-3